MKINAFEMLNLMNLYFIRRKLSMKFFWSWFHTVLYTSYTYQNFVVLASQKFPGIWHRLFDQPLYMDFGGVFSFSVTVWSWKLFQI